MIEEVLKEVKEAEAKADEMIESALRQSADIKAAGDQRCAEILKDAKKNARESYDKALEDAHKIADESFASEMEKCRKEGENLKSSLNKKADALAKDIFGRIVNGGC